MFGDWRDTHYSIIVTFISNLNKQFDNFVLKGGTALMLCYGLDRFSEDIDLDEVALKKYGRKTDIKDFIDRFCTFYKVNYRIAKDTDTVKRFFIHYGGKKPLKVEISYRSRNIISQDQYGVINGVLVYTISQMAVLKLGAFNNRDKIRDLYDLVFICKNYIGYLPSSIVDSLRNAFSYKDLGYFDYLMKTQDDEFIDCNKLASDFLDVYYYLGLG